MDEANDRFIQHLEKASLIVKSWPLWKQNVLGSIKPTQEVQPPMDEMGEIEEKPTLATLDELMLQYNLSIEVIPEAERGYDKSAAFMATHLGGLGSYAPSTHRTAWAAALHQAGKIQYDIDLCERVERERERKSKEATDG